MVMSAVDLAKNNPDPTEHEVREWLEGNLCRCTGYHNIVKSVIAGAKSMRGSAMNALPETGIGAPCAAAKISASSPGAGTTPTTSTAMASFMPGSCARRTPTR